MNAGAMVSYMRRHGKGAEADALERPNTRMDKARIKEQCVAAAATAESATEKRKAGTAELLAKLAQPKGIECLVSAAEKNAEEKQKLLVEISAKADQVHQRADAGDPQLGQWRQTLLKKTQKQIKAALKALKEKRKAAGPSAAKLPTTPTRKEDMVRMLLGLDITTAEAFDELLSSGKCNIASFIWLSDFVLR